MYWFGHIFSRGISKRSKSANAINSWTKDHADPVIPKCQIKVSPRSDYITGIRDYVMVPSPCTAASTSMHAVL
jgi:hypothetical protein